MKLDFCAYLSLYQPPQSASLTAPPRGAYGDRAPTAGKIQKGAAALFWSFEG